MNLKYGEVYDLKIAGEDYKGIYLGVRVPRIRPKSKDIILVNKSSNKLSLYPYSLIAFSNYRLNEEKKLILQKMYPVRIASIHREYLEELCKKLT